MTLPVESYFLQVWNFTRYFEFLLLRTGNDEAVLIMLIKTMMNKHNVTLDELHTRRCAVQIISSVKQEH